MNTPAEIAQDKGQSARPEPRPRAHISTHYLRSSISNGEVMLLGFISLSVLVRSFTRDRPKKRHAVYLTQDRAI